MITCRGFGTCRVGAYLEYLQSLEAVELEVHLQKRVVGAGCLKGYVSHRLYLCSYHILFHLPLHYHIGGSLGDLPLELLWLMESQVS